MGKLLESIITNEISQLLESNNYINNTQHGFRRHRSCLTNLLEFFHKILIEYDSSSAVDVFYLDFKKALDKVPHKRLMMKVRAAGITGTWQIGLRIGYQIESKEW